MNASHLTGPKESCKEKDLLHFLEAFLLRKTGLPTPRRCAPESRSLAAPYAARKWVRALPDYFKAEAHLLGLRPMGFGMNALGMAPPLS